MSSPPPTLRPPANARWQAALHVFTLTSLAVAQPIYDLFSLDPMILVTNRARPLEIWCLVGALSVLLPAALVLLEALAHKIRPWLQRGLHLAIVAAACFLIALPALKRVVLLPGIVLISLAAAAGVLAAVAYWRLAPLRTLLTFASPCVLAFPIYFVGWEPIRSLLSPVDSVQLAAKQGEVRPPVVMVLLDEFCGASLLDEHRRIDAARYPNFAALAERCTWHRNATTVAENTLHAVPALLTGNRPDHDFPPTVANYPHNLFTLLGPGCGYEMTVFEPFTSLCPDQSPEAAALAAARRRQNLAAETLGVYVQFLIPADMAELPAPTRARDIRLRNFARLRQREKGLIRYDRMELRHGQFDHFLESIKASEKPTLNFIHVLLPHYPYEYLPSGKNHAGDATGRRNAIGMQAVIGESGRRSDDAQEASQSQQLYLLQVGFVDHQIGRLVARLKEIDLYDRCLLVIVADHGVSFRPGEPARDATRVNFPDILSVPLFIKAPGQTQGEINDRNVETIDVLPTMAQMLGIELPWRTEGASASDSRVTPRPTKSIHTLNNGLLTFDGAFLERDSSMLQMLELFGSGAKPDGLYRLGPHGELIGKQISDLKVGSPSKTAVEYNRSATWDRYDPAGDHAPCVLDGSVDEASVVDGPAALAVVVNGTVRAVVKTFASSDRRQQWRAVIPESSFVPGPNDIRFYVVEGAGEAAVLHAAASDYH